MAGEALFIGWGEVVRGREQVALQVFQESVEFWGKAQQDGRIERFDAYLLAPHGGDLAGFFLMHGEQSSLDSLQSSDDFLRLMTRANAVVERLGTINAYSGESLGRQMGFFNEVAQEMPQSG